MELDREVEIVLTDNYLQEGLAEFNRQALKSGRSWMLVKPVGTTVWIGPLFVPGKTGCWECLAQRLRPNRPVEMFVEKRKGISPAALTPAVSVPSASETGLNIATTEIIKWIVGDRNEALEGTIVTFDTLSLQTRDHVLVKRPQCPACGERDTYRGDREPEPLVLETCPKTFTADGGHRRITPEETLEKYGHHHSPITGAVRQLVKATPDSNGLLHMYSSGHNFSRVGDDLYFLRQGCRAQSAGKGKTDAQAKASAICEALERYSGLYQGYEICRKATYNDLGNAAIHPNLCMQFSDAQYANRKEWNAQCKSKLNLVVEPFDDTAEVEWTPVWSLSEQRFKYLPTAFCYYNYPHYPSACCPADSNGNAAGNTKEEAIVQGFMELVERDSIALWWYNRIKRPAVDLESFDDPYGVELRDYYRSVDRDLWVLDLTSDFNIPVFAAISARTDKPAQDIIYAFGAHFDAKIALLRALTEVNQVLPSVSGVAPDGSVEYNDWDALALDWWTQATLESEPYVVPDNTVPAKRYSDYSRLDSKDLLDDVMTCVNLAKERGMETLILDQTRPDIGLNVVKVIVPGLRHFWRRLAPGRLYETPVKLGWLSQPIPEEKLNPWSIFF